ncbi:hypothetical protein [Bradyrhizobium yuanmingense]|uniref:hypothetical protein n=1 Tax=Bradyrhizobium yuanmingense TaxID=108015 RepID=UPI0023B9E56B|nr:hypothetical protein [Bradyrhizobium yuanmingense]MDF0498106.1 hypothetical protein [Bradyrhizobium yuanmingense]
MHDLQSRQSSERSLHTLRIGLADGADQARHLFVSREVKSERPSILVMRAAPACGNAGYVRAGKIARPAAGVIVLFAAMPTGANVYILAVQYQRLVNPVSGAVALGTLRRRCRWWCGCWREGESCAPTEIQLPGLRCSA